jgi:hypothetical protein
MEKNHNQSPIDLETLIRDLKTEDNRNLKLMLNFQGLIWAVAAIYILLSIFNLFLQVPWYKSLGVFILLLVFIGYGLRSRIYRKKMESIDYGIPTIIMLAKAAHRYRLKIFRGNVIVEITLLLLVDIGICLMFYGHPIFTFLFIQGFFVFVFAITFSIGYIIWKKRQKPLRDHALALLKEFES